MIQEEGKWYVFEDYDDELLNRRIAYWETQQDNDPNYALEAMYAERDRRFHHKMLAWVEQK